MRRNQGSQRWPSAELSECSDIAVRTVPGPNANTETPNGFASMARHSVKRISADLLLMYAEKYAIGTALLTTLMMRPERRAIIAAITAWLHTIGPRRLTVCVRHQSVDEDSQNGPIGPRMAALFTSRPTRPHLARTSSM